MHNAHLPSHAELVSASLLLMVNISIPVYPKKENEFDFIIPLWYYYFMFKNDKILVKVDKH